MRTPSFLGRAYGYIRRGRRPIVAPSLGEWLSPSHVVWLLLDIAGRLDELAPARANAREGELDASRMTALLLYAYCSGERSSRRIARLSRLQVALRVIAENRPLDHREIADFRERNAAVLAPAFARALELCRSLGLGRVASLELGAGPSGTNGGEPRDLAKIARAMVEEARKKDSEEDRAGDLGADEVPDDLRDPVRRAARVAECLDVLRRAPAAEPGRDEGSSAEVRRSELARRRQNAFASILHDLRNPVGTITLTSAYLSSIVPEGNAAIRKCAEMFRSAAARASRLAEELATLALTDVDELSLVIGRHDARELAAEAIGLAEPLAREKSIELSLDVVGEPGPVACDRSQVERVFANLLENAVKFGNARGRVVLRVERQEGAVRFSVIDDGPGIEGRDLGRIFERGFQVAPDARGNGLGLSIAKAIVEAHRGTISAESGPGRGTMIFFALPHAA